MLQLLRDNGAKIRVTDLGMASQAGAISTYQYLLENGSGLQACVLDQGPGFWNFGFNTSPPLGSAIRRNNLPSVSKLLELGARVITRCNVPNGLGGDYNFSAILVAAHFGDPEIIRLLVEEGANPNALSLTGLTPISIAAENGHYDAVGVLLEKGAFHTYSTDLKLPIEIANDSGHGDIVEMLQNAGAAFPRRTSPPKILGRTLANTIVEGVVVAASIYLVVEGISYSMRSEVPGRNENQSSVSASQRQEETCRSDYQCSPIKICIKKFGSLVGRCILDPKVRGPRPGSIGLPEICDPGAIGNILYERCGSRSEGVNLIWTVISKITSISHNPLRLASGS